MAEESKIPRLDRPLRADEVVVQVLETTKDWVRIRLWPKVDAVRSILEEYDSVCAMSYAVRHYACGRALYCGVGLANNTADELVYLDVSLSISKGEIDEKSMRLLCDVNFTSLSGWYEKLKAYQAQGAGGGKTYSYTYPYTYTSSAQGTVDIPNGNLPSYPKITIFGPVSNPFWALYQGATRLQTGRLKLTVPDGNKLVIDSHPATMEIAEYTRGGQFIANRYGDSDFTTTRLFMLPAGQCSVVFTQDGVGVVDAFVEVKKRV